MMVSLPACQGDNNATLPPPPPLIDINTIGMMYTDQVIQTAGVRTCFEYCDLGFASKGSVQTAATEGDGGAGKAAAGEGGEHIVRHAGAGHQV
jgi:hypothetical protein